MNLYAVVLNGKCVGIVPKENDKDKAIPLDVFVNELFNNLGFRSYSEYLRNLPGRSDTEQERVAFYEATSNYRYTYGKETPETMHNLLIEFANTTRTVIDDNGPYKPFYIGRINVLPEFVDPSMNGGDNCMFLVQTTKAQSSKAGALFNHELWFCLDWTDDEESKPEPEPKPIPHKSIYSNYRIQMDYDPNPNTSREYVTNMVIGLVGFFSPIVWSIVFRLLR